MSSSLSASETPTVQRLEDQFECEGAYGALELAYSAYSANPTRAYGFGALRALVRWCRWSGFSVDAAKLFAEMARVDEETDWPFQIVFKRRRKTKAMRALDKARSTGNLARRNENLFRRVIWRRTKHDEPLPDTFAAVASDTNLGAEMPLSDETVRKAYQAMSKRIRAMGDDEVLARSPNFIGDILNPPKLVPLPKPGRPRKKLGK